MGDYSKRVAYVMSLINIKQKMCQRKKVDISEKQRNRTFSREYFLRINGEKKQICCSCFLSTLGETKGFLNTVASKCIASKSGVPQNDFRGKKEPSNKHSEQDLQKAKDHILIIPSYESHYSRRDTTTYVFYKRQLWTYNLTVHDCSDNQAYCFMWCEVDGGRGANQIASCVSKHLYTIGLPTKYVTLYSDTCGGQNKNSYMTVIRYHNTL